MYIPILIIIMYVVKLRGQLYCLLRGTVTAYHSQHACILVKTLHAWSYIHVHCTCTCTIHCAIYTTWVYMYMYMS